MSKPNPNKVNSGWEQQAMRTILWKIMNSKKMALANKHGGIKVVQVNKWEVPDGHDKPSYAVVPITYESDVIGLRCSKFGWAGISNYYTGDLNTIVVFGVGSDVQSAMADYMWGE